MSGKLDGMDLSNHIITGAGHLRPNDTDASAGTVLKSFADYARAAEVELRHQVTVARSMGLSWQQVGDALGVSKQAAHERYSDGR